jgi:glutathione synthase/RimK-type ligase-like ATP-grasp enzyme
MSDFDVERRRERVKIPALREKTPSVALATSRDLADLWAGDRLFLHELRRRALTAAPLVWDDEDVDWRAWDVVVIRSCWDYHLKIDRFRAWIDRLEAAGVPVVNPPDVLRWNMHKGYLLEVARAGGRIPPTRLVPHGAQRPLRDELRDAGWTSAVIKPAISASGQGTRLVEGEPRGDDEESYAAMRAAGDVLLQAYVPEVTQRGEWSLVFFAGRYSHAALKRAAPGEFRVHIEWGGTVESAEPPPALVLQAQALVDALDLDATYARVDGTEVGGDLVVMELELIEPELFFDCHPEATARLADAVLDRREATALRLPTP